MSDPFNLERFKVAQDVVYHRVVAELSDGRKRSHWMWYIFPQINGLGFSFTAKEYAIQSLQEAQAYLDDTLLNGRLTECSELLLKIENRTALEILGSPDDLKLRSCMTLFAQITDQSSVFRQVLDKYFQGEMDPLTLSQLD